jgi:hypothetical protein
MKDEEPLEPDPVIEAYKKDIDRTLIRQSLKLTVEQRFREGMALARFANELRRAGRDFTLETTIGNIDALGEMAGGGTYEDLFPGSVELELFGIRCRCLSLRQLIRAKRAAGRPRDFDTIAEPEAIEEESRG